MGVVSESTAKLPSKLTISQETLRQMMAAGVAITPALTRLISDFWGLPIQLQCFSVSPQNLYFWRLDEFYVSQLSLESSLQKMVQLRLSDTACSALLTQVLGPRPIANNAFQFNRITPFEATLLARFSKELLATLAKTLLKKPTTYTKKDSFVHLIWLMKLDFPEKGESHGAGKIILTVPAEAVGGLEEFSAQEEATAPLPEVIFDHAHAAATLQIGQTRLRLEELQGLEAGDIVVLEKSQTNRMALVEPFSNIHFPFTASLLTPNTIELPYTQEIAMMEKHHETPPKETLWDNLLIDVTAEFQPTRMPLNQLRQMTEGLVVEIGDLIHNQVRLHVEGKTFAKGELVIVGDKFGVRIQKLLEESEEGTSPELLNNAMTVPPAMSASHSATHPPAALPAPSMEEADATPKTVDPLDEIDQFLNDDFDEGAFGTEEEEEW